MDNPKTKATLGTQETEQRSKKKRGETRCSRRINSSCFLKRHPLCYSLSTPVKVWQVIEEQKLDSNVVTYNIAIPTMSPTEQTECNCD